MRAFVLLACLLAVAHASGVAHPRTLVLYDDVKVRQTHSIFLSSLQARGHTLTFAHVNDEEVKLQKYGEYLFENLVLFSPSAEDLPAGVSHEEIVAFIDSGRNALIAVNRNVSEPIRNVANECGIDFDEEETAVIDHVNFDVSDATNGDGTHTIVVSDKTVKSSVLLGKGPSAPVLFRGIGHAGTSGTRLLIRVLTGSETAYSAVPGAKVVDFPQSAGTDTLLVTAMQARNNARVVFSGSLDLFSDKFFSAPVQVYSAEGTGKKHAKSGNEEFAIELSQWNFAERGLLRASNLTHKLAGSHTVNPQQYRIKDEIDFSIQIEEWSQSKQAWVPFTENDVQLEFVMIDPYIRTTLKHDGHGNYATRFTAPDVYGVFKFRIAYRKLGYSNLEVSQQVAVHPFRHNEFERFIDVAYPYYISAFSVFAGFALFGVVFLYHKD